MSYCYDQRNGISFAISDFLILIFIVRCKLSTEDTHKMGQLSDTITLSCEHTFAKNELTKAGPDISTCCFVYLEIVIVFSTTVWNTVDVCSSQRVESFVLSGFTNLRDLIMYSWMLRVELGAVLAASGAALNKKNYFRAGVHKSRTIKCVVSSRQASVNETSRIVKVGPQHSRLFQGYINDEMKM